MSAPTDALAAPDHRGWDTLILYFLNDQPNRKWTMCIRSSERVLLCMQVLPLIWSARYTYRVIYTSLYWTLSPIDHASQATFFYYTAIPQFLQVTWISFVRFNVHYCRDFITYKSLFISHLFVLYIFPFFFEYILVSQ